MKKVDQYIDSKKYDKESVLLFLHKKSEHFYPSLYEYWGKDMYLRACVRLYVCVRGGGVEDRRRLKRI